MKDHFQLQLLHRRHSAPHLKQRFCFFADVIPIQKQTQPDTDTSPSHLYVTNTQTHTQTAAQTRFKKLINEFAIKIDDAPSKYNHCDDEADGAHGADRAKGADGVWFCVKIIVRQLNPTNGTFIDNGLDIWSVIIYQRRSSDENPTQSPHCSHRHRHPFNEYSSSSFWLFALRMLNILRLLLL